MKLVFVLAAMLLAFSANAQTPTDRQAILSILQRQTQDWNAGRIDAFMQAGYWPSDSLTFVGKAGVTYGYAATLASYHKRYPSREAMGTLRFDVLKVSFLGVGVAQVIGRWHLTRPQLGDAGGYFTLLWRKIGSRWLIVSDHTS